MRAGQRTPPSAVAYSRCMRSHGVPDFPDPDSNGQLPKTTSGSSSGSAVPVSRRPSGLPAPVAVPGADPGPAAAAADRGPEVRPVHALPRGAELPRPHVGSDGTADFVIPRQQSASAHRRSGHDPQICRSCTGPTARRRCQDSVLATAARLGRGAGGAGRWQAVAGWVALGIWSWWRPGRCRRGGPGCSPPAASSGAGRRGARAGDGGGDAAGPRGDDAGDRDAGVRRVLPGDRAGRRDADLAAAAGQVIGQGQVLYRTGNGSPGGAAVRHGAGLAGPGRGRHRPGRVPAQPRPGGASATPAARISPRWAGITSRGRRRTGCSGWKSTWGSPARRESLSLGQVVFEPEALRVSQVTGSLGGPATGPVLTATSDRHVVTIALDASAAVGGQGG